MSAFLPEALSHTPWPTEVKVSFYTGKPHISEGPNSVSELHPRSHYGLYSTWPPKQQTVKEKGDWIRGCYGSVAIVCGVPSYENHTDTGTWMPHHILTPHFASETLGWAQRVKEEQF